MSMDFVEDGHALQFGGEREGNPRNSGIIKREFE